MSTKSNKQAVSLSRRRALKTLSAVAAVPVLGGFAPSVLSAPKTIGRVVVVGGGFGGATAAKYLKIANPAIDVTLVEPALRFYTCPFSNLFLGGLRTFDSISHGYDELRDRYGVQVLHAMAEEVDSEHHRVTLADGTVLDYDRLILSPGIDIRWDGIEGYDEEAAEEIPHAWKAGAQTELLRKQIESMDDGGVFMLTAPANPFRCPPGPYERVSMVAHYLKQHKPRSKVIILDAKDSFSKQGLFQEGWDAVYGDMIEWVSLSNDGKIIRVDAANREVETEFGELHRPDVLNVVPPQKAGWIAARAGVTDASGWVPVKPDTFESQLVKDIYVVGDATIAGPMPKSGFCASAQAKVAAAAIAASFEGRESPDPYWINTCYSLIAPEYGISVAGVYRVKDGEIISVPDSGGVSPMGAPASVRAREAEYAVGWYRAICQDTWGSA